MKTANYKPISVALFLWQFIKQHLKIYLLLFTCVILVSSASSLYPYFFKQLVNQISHYQVGSSMQPLWESAIAIVMVWGCSELLSNLQDFIAIYTFPQFKVAIRQYLVEHVIKKPFNYFSGELTGAIGERLSSVPMNCLNLLSIFTFNFFSTFITLTSSFLLMVSVGGKYIVMLCIWGTVHLSVALFYKDPLNALCEKHAKTRANLSGTIYDILVNLFNIHAFCGWRHERHYFYDVQLKDMRQEQDTMHGFLHMKLLQSLAIIMLLAAVVFSLVHDWQRHVVNLGEITLVMMLAVNIINCIRGISANINAFIIDKSNVSESLHFLSLDHMPSTALIDASNPVLSVNSIKEQDKIIFDHISFRYAASAPWVIKDLSLEINVGEHIGLVGLSGAGKTTLLKLLLGFYQPTQGQIMIAGNDINKMPVEELRNQISLVPQDPLLFHRTIGENIQYSKLDAPRSEILEAVERANCQWVLEKTEHGLDTIINDAGSNFSRGQLQRIVLARGILRNSPIVLLDEPTASVDLINEKYIQASIDKLIAGKTAIIVAHRLETLKNVDRIVVLDKGKIVQQGSFNELLKTDGLFSTMWQSRQQTFEYE